MCTNIGHMNANVLPLPVLAIPMDDYNKLKILI